MGISENIKLLREQYGLSQKELGQIAGVSDKAVSTWEQGIKEPRMGAIQKIADHFGIQKSNIIEDNGLQSQSVPLTPPAMNAKSPPTSKKCLPTSTAKTQWQPWAVPLKMMKTENS